MSVKYRNQNGQETIIAGLTPGGDIEAGAVMTRSGQISIEPLAIGEYKVVTVTFDTPMPDDTYIINIDCTSGRLNIATFGKTANGFSIIYLNSSNLVQPQGDSIDWTATKTYTVQHAQQNAEDIAALKQATPAGAGPSNKFATANDITRVENSVEDISEVIDSTASITNKLVSKSTMDTALGGKQDTLTFDNAPTAGSENPVKSSGIKDVIDNTAADIYEVMGKNGAKNLLPNITVSRTISGITYTRNSNDSVTINGTSTGWGQNDVGKCLLPKGTYTISVGVTVPSGVFFTLRNDDTDSSILNLGNGGAETKRNFTLASDTNIRLYCGISGSVTVSNITFYPMVYLSSDTDSTYQPYAETNYQLTQDKISYADNGFLGAKNLLPNNGSDRHTATGITFTKNTDGTVTINGTATAYTLYNLFTNNASFVVENKNGLIVSALQNDVTLRVKDSDETWYGSSTREVIIPAGKNIVAGSIAVGNGTTLNNYTVGPMLRCISDPDPTYQPYAMTNQQLTKNFFHVKTVLVTFPANSIDYWFTINEIANAKGVIISALACYGSSYSGIQNYNHSLMVNTDQYGRIGIRLSSAPSSAFPIAVRVIWADQSVLI